MRQFLTDEWKLAKYCCQYKTGHCFSFGSVFVVGAQCPNPAPASRVGCIGSFAGMDEEQCYSLDHLCCWNPSGLQAHCYFRKKIIIMPCCFYVV